MPNKNDKLKGDFLRANRFRPSGRWYQRARRKGDCSLMVLLNGKKSMVRVIEHAELEWDDDQHEMTMPVFVAARGPITCGEMEKILRRLGMRVYVGCS